MPTSNESFSGDEQTTIALGEGFAGGVADDHTSHYFDAPVSTANVVTLTAGQAVTTHVWKRRYPVHSKTPSYRMVFRKGQVPTQSDIDSANAGTNGGIV